MNPYTIKYKLEPLLFVSLFLALLMLNACSATKFIPENKYMLDKVKVTADNKNVAIGDLKSCVRQRENSRWFSLVKMPMLPYALSGQDSTKRINRILQRIGQAPVVYDSILAERSASRITSVVCNAGYLDAKTHIKTKKKRRKITVEYHVQANKLYRINRIDYHITDKNSARLLADPSASLLKKGDPLNILKLDSERNRINSLLHNEGYFKFHKDYITFKIDTCQISQEVDLQCTISPTATLYETDTVTSFTPYYLRNIYILSDVDLSNETVVELDTIQYDNYKLIYSQKPRFRSKLFVQNTLLEPNSLYRERNVQGTYNNYGALRGVKFSTVRLIENVGADSLDCYVHVASNKFNSVGFEVEGTNTVGDLGAAAALTLQNRNIFRGSELLSLKVRGAFEAITGLEGYFDQNYFEITTELGLTFPTIQVPFIRSSAQKTMKSSTEFSFLYNSQNRPEFHRRVITGVWRYRWNQFGSKGQHRFDLFDLNYVFMPWISDTFRKEYLENENTQNSILRYNYENLFIMKLGYSYAYNSLGSGVTTSTYGRNAFAFRFNIESSGNVLYALSNLLKAQQNAEGSYTLFNIAYAEYVKGDFDFSKSIMIDPNNSFAFHLGLGVAYPYGNSSILPYEKRYFSGGANSVRGWSVRELGPGSYSGGNGRINFINQTGDIKLDLNIEYRTQLFWKLNGAVFVDAGNIWTIRHYEDQPGGQFKFDTFWKQIAVAYGIGLRFNFDYFIIRLDGGMRAINPVHTNYKEQFSIFYPKWSRDFTFHFAVGLPF